MIRFLPVYLLAPLLLLPFQMVSTPQQDETSFTENHIEMMYVQNYIDMSEEARESGTLPEIVMIYVQELETPEIAENAFEVFTSTWSGDVETTTTEIDDLGDEAKFVESVDAGGDHGAWTVARHGDVIITAFVTGAPDAPEISQDIVRFIIEHGPSDQEVIVNADGVVTGGWADAFPQPEDIDGLAHHDPAPVTKFPPDQEEATSSA